MPANIRENTFAGGTIRVHGTCQQPGRGTMQMNMDGSYTATTMTRDGDLRNACAAGHAGAADRSACRAR